jgi:hypothetical protein
VPLKRLVREGEQWSVIAITATKHGGLIFAHARHACANIDLGKALLDVEHSTQFVSRQREAKPDTPIFAAFATLGGPPTCMYTDEDGTKMDM